MSQHLRILHLRASEFYGGPERQLHYHARRARGSAYDITIASFTEGGTAPSFLEEFERDGISTHVFRVRSAYDPGTIQSIREHLESAQVDVLCTHDYRSDILASVCVPGTRAKWVAFSRGFTRIDLKVRLYQVVDKFVLRFADHLVAVSEAQKRKLTRLWIDSDRISVVRNVIDSSVGSDLIPVDLRQRFGLSAEHRICVSAGRFSPEKGQDVLIRAARIALDADPGLRFILFGDGFELDRGRALVERLGLANAVFCPGFEPRILECIAGADVLVNPSHSEGLPNVLLEGMLLGVPIVATAVGGVPEILRDGHSAHLVPAGDPQALAEHILDTTQREAAARDRAAAARAFIEEHCTVNRQYETLVEVYDRVSGTRPASTPTEA